MKPLRDVSRFAWIAIFFVMAVAITASAQSAADARSLPPTAQPDQTTATAKAHDDTYTIGADDVLAINVWKETELTRSVPVRSDGKISLPLIGELQASGITPKQLEQDIAKKLASYVSEPEVTVIVQEIKSRKFNVLGMVARPGSFPITHTMTVLDAIAVSGGFRDFAKQKSIYVLRMKPDGTQERIPFNYKDVVKGKNPEQNIKLEPGDSVVVP